MDIREQRTPNGVTYDHARMVIIIEDYGDGGFEIPAVFGVCQTCNGKGHHVNPSIDSHGISAEEMYEDPEFAEDYFGGVFDVDCNECEGLRVVLVPDDRNAKPEAIAALDGAWRFESEYAAECEAERRMGA
ncbi:hypothetical protein LCGC14_1552590 [marine sediment metagenome]|uniref:Uncharacterized protein n=2 Tax=root TaxID=1 RepID=A0A9C9TI03_9HYPH|nr:hypothetical protein [Aurantimonas coralicida]